MSNFSNLSLKSTKALALRLGKNYQNKDVVIGLIGNLGSGKTTFIKSFAKAFKINRVQSPTFVIAHKYKTKKRNFYHIDFYRLHSAKQLTVLGIEEILKSKIRTVVIEWVDRFPKIKKRCDVIIKFNFRSKNSRDISITKN
jgi:tRNA threonylcarbamoyladenosine biosynthesis protein TsaE